MLAYLYTREEEKEEEKTIQRREYDSDQSDFTMMKNKKKTI